MSDDDALRTTPRRSVLASAAAVSVLGATGCRTSGLFTGPDPLGNPPPLAQDTQVLQTVIAAENGLVAMYRSASGHDGLLRGLLAEHEQHLVQLRAWLVTPAGAASSPSPSPVVSAAAAHSLTQLRAAEQQSSLVFLQYLGDVGPALAQLFASIAASDFTHQAALTAAGAR